MQTDRIVTSAQVLHVQTGTVGRGSAVAKVLGYPTANIHCEHPGLSGTYAGYVSIDGMSHRAAVYADCRRRILESHIFGFSGNLYGAEIIVTLLEKIAEAEEIRDRERLRTHIAEVVEKTKRYFQSIYPESQVAVEESAS